MNADNGRWNHLSRGSKLLIQDCGPARFVAPFERAMLESQRAFFVSSSLFSVKQVVSPNLGRSLLAEGSPVSETQIVQDVNAGQNCFLSQSQWRQLLQNTAVPPVAQGPPSLSLRAKLCDWLVDIPDLLSEVSNLSDLDGSRSLDLTDSESRHERVLLRAIAMNRRIETWCTKELEPLLLSCDSLSNASLKSNGPSWGTRTNTGNDFEYPELLLAVLDCVSNSVLIKLKELLSTLTSASSQQHEELVNICPATIARRKATVRVSLDFVKRNSKVAAKPLEFGLEQLWSIDGVLGQYSISDTSENRSLTGS